MKIDVQKELLIDVLYLISRIDWFGSILWNQRNRGDALEALHKLDLIKISTPNLTQLHHACVGAINSYARCSGYSKHWKFFKEKIERIIKDRGVSEC